MYFVFILASTIRSGGYCGRVAKKQCGHSQEDPINHINYVLDGFEGLYNESAACINPDEL